MRCMVTSSIPSALTMTATGLPNSGVALKTSTTRMRWTAMGHRLCDATDALKLRARSVDMRGVGLRMRTSVALLLIAAVAAGAALADGSGIVHGVPTASRPAVAAVLHDT